jgi:hypothetical protein
MARTGMARTGMARTGMAGAGTVLAGTVLAGTGAAVSVGTVPRWTEAAGSAQRASTQRASAQGATVGDVLPARNQMSGTSSSMPGAGPQRVARRPGPASAVAAGGVPTLVRLDVMVPVAKVSAVSRSGEMTLAVTRSGGMALVVTRLAGRLQGGKRPGATVAGTGRTLAGIATELAGTPACPELTGAAAGRWPAGRRPLGRPLAARPEAGRPIAAGTMRPFQAATTVPAATQDLIVAVTSTTAPTTSSPPAPPRRAEPLVAASTPTTLMTPGPEWRPGSTPAPAKMAAHPIAGHWAAGTHRRAMTASGVATPGPMPGRTPVRVARARASEMTRCLTCARGRVAASATTTASGPARSGTSSPMSTTGPSWRRTSR